MIWHNQSWTWLGSSPLNSMFDKSLSSQKTKTHPAARIADVFRMKKDFPTSMRSHTLHQSYIFLSVITEVYKDNPAYAIHCHFPNQYIIWSKLHNKLDFILSSIEILCRLAQKECFYLPFEGMKLPIRSFCLVLLLLNFFKSTLSQNQKSKTISTFLNLPMLTTFEW